MTARTKSSQKNEPGKPSRGETRYELLRAAESLFAEKGIGAASTRSILRRAGQRNESALQYHFGGREGLIEALYLERGAQIAEERERQLATLLERTERPTVRQLCEVALMPPVNLARRDEELAQFLKIVGQMAFLPNERLKQAQQRYEFGSVAKVGEILRERLDLPEKILEQRGELFSRMAAVALANWARAERRFDGTEADLYFATVLDAMTAVLTGPLSDETERALASSQDKQKRNR